MNNFVIDDTVTFSERIDELTLPLLEGYNVFLVGTHDLTNITASYLKILSKKSPKQLFTLSSAKDISQVYNTRNKKLPSMFFLFSDFQKLDIASADDYVTTQINQIDEILTYLSESNKNYFQLSSLIPEILTESHENIIALAENEYYFHYKDKSDSIHSYVIKLENYLKNATSRHGQIQCTRIDRLFGPGITDDLTGISELCRQIYQSKEVVLTEDKKIASVVYVQDAVLLMVLALLKGRKGNVYHISSPYTSSNDLLLVIYKLFRDLYDLKIKDSVNHSYESDVPIHILNSCKSNLIFIKDWKYLPFEDALKNTFCFVNNIDSYPASVFNVNYNRIEVIRKLEIGILDEIDRICKKHDIKYFLIAGTMLGAIRHNGFIPWDDDVDIGMIPEEYNKFRKVVQKELDPKYGYQNCFSEPASHYIHDKIGLNSTYFSTRYSDRYRMMNGVYIDIFVYYKTANSPYFQKKHINDVAKWRKVVGARWSTRPAQSIKGKLLIFLVKLFPSKWIDFCYRMVCLRYQHRKTNFRIDGGFNLEKAGAVPGDWFLETTTHVFEGKEYPILKAYDAFLSHWYSKKYMELPPLSMRTSVHDCKRIDLGQYLENPNSDTIEPLDIRGELF